VQVRSISEGALAAASTVALVAVGRIVPGVAVFVAPVPLFVYALRHGASLTLLTAVSSSVVLTTFLDLPRAILSAAFILMAGGTQGLAARKGGSFLLCVSLGGLAVAGLALLTLLLARPVFGLDVGGLAIGLQNALGWVIEISENSELPAIPLLTVLRSGVPLVPDLMFALFFVGAFVLCSVVYSLGSVAHRIVSTPVPPGSDTLALPHALTLVIAAASGLAGVAALTHLSTTFALNFVVPAVLVLGLQGLLVLGQKFEAHTMTRGLWFIGGILAVGLLIPWLLFAAYAVLAALPLRLRGSRKGTRQK
jgi:hypothetical protein